MSYRENTCTCTNIIGSNTTNKNKEQTISSTVSFKNKEQTISSTVSFKCSTYISYLIHSSKKGFLKGRYISECVRIISDFMDKLKEDNIPGLLMLVDFEKAFDTVEWPFIEKKP